MAIDFEARRSRRALLTAALGGAAAAAAASVVRIGPAAGGSTQRSGGRATTSASPSVLAAGVATIKRGKRSVTVDTSGHLDVNPHTVVLLTPMANIGSRCLWYTKKPALDRIVIRMSATRKSATQVGWLVLDR
jgi:hypothetical protein